MRLFLAFPLPPEITGSIGAIQKQLPKKELRLPESAHLTVKFLGEVDNKKVDEIKAIVAGIKHEKFGLTLGDISAFPNLARPRVIWLAVEPTEPVLEIQQLAEKALLPLFPADDKFSPHITLARVKEELSPETAKKIEDIVVQPKTFIVDKLVLYKSVLTREGPIYTELLSVQLS